MLNLAAAAAAASITSLNARTTGKSKKNPAIFHFSPPSCLSVCLSSHKILFKWKLEVVFSASRKVLHYSQERKARNIQA